MQMSLSGACVRVCVCVYVAYLSLLISWDLELQANIAVKDD